ncbi:TolC family protein [Lichenibacterium minor]|uniref:TolC family protein n=1 Tax=Lichenibacterium minor TaxID=2316528 RepID=A0A4Q2U469_9HYPH|nr:TolC family protein [Lichenibacterium minor]RYC31339.1 TolC family protein [Lichenibacterium minor]
MSARSRLRAAAAPVAGLALSACASFSPDGGMDAVQATISTGVGAGVSKVSDEATAGTAHRAVAGLLRAHLTPGSAVQVALLSNRGLQAAFHDLGVSEAAYVQASLPPVPRFTYARLTGPGEIDVTYAVVASLFDLATLPARKGIAERRFRATQDRAAEQALTLAAEARRQYYRAVAADQSVAFLEQALASAEAASTLATQLGESGALNKLEQAREHAFTAEIGAQLARARVQKRVEREALVRRLGLWGPELAFRLPSALPSLPRRPRDGGALEAEALRRRIDLRVARSDLAALAGEYDLGTATRLVSAFDISFLSNPESTAKAGVAPDGTPTIARDNVQRRGPSIDFAVPIYDFGETAVRGARESYLAAAHRLAERAISARSEVREAYGRYRGEYDITRHYAETVLPLNKTILDQSVLQFSGMLVDVSQLIIDARTRILSNIQAIEARRDFWIAAADLDASVIGGGFGPGAPEAAAPLADAAPGPTGAAGG